MTNKNKNNQYINTLIINTFIFFWLIFFYSIFIKPELEQLKINKESLYANLNEYYDIKQKWIDYNTFKSLISWDNKNLNNIVNSMWETFFSSSLKNTWSWDYLDFLKSKETNVNNLKKSDLIAKRDEKISKVLPFYTQGIKFDWSITDLSFINYVETILRTFSLRTDSQIWLWEVSPLSQSKPWVSQSLSSEIFYTDLPLKLEWRKSDILDFLYFIQNVWKIDIENKNNTQDVVFYKDNYFSNKIVSWQPRTFDYNIYENKFVDIESLSINSYIDDSISSRNNSQSSTTWFLYFIKSTPESNEIFSVDVKLRFYFRWLPSYKIEIYVQNVLNRFDSLSKDIKQNLAKWQNRNLVQVNTQILSVVNNLKNLDNYIQTNQDKIKKLRQSLSKKEGLDKIYYEASDLNFDLDIISSTLSKNKQELEKTLNTKK